MTLEGRSETVMQFLACLLEYSCWSHQLLSKLSRTHHAVGKPKWIQVQFSHSVMYDSLWSHGLQHARPPCPSPTPRVYSNSCLLSRWCHPTISSSVIPFSSCLQSFPVSGSFPMSQSFASGDQSIGARNQTEKLSKYCWSSLQVNLPTCQNFFVTQNQYLQRAFVGSFGDMHIVKNNLSHPMHSSQLMLNKTSISAFLFQRSDGASGKESTCQCRRRETQVWSLGQEGPVEEGMATHSSILAWRIPWTEEPGRVHGVAKNQTQLKWLSTFAHTKQVSVLRSNVLCHVLLSVCLYFLLVFLLLKVTPKCSVQVRPCVPKCKT